MIDGLVRNENGFTTFGVVIALLLSLSLIFSSAQVYRVNSQAAAIQDVADAAALAAENEVAEFVLAARVCDAVVLSLSLASCVSAGLGVVCFCVPAAQGMGDIFVKAAKSFAQARNSFAENATTGLNTIQRALPFIACAKAALVARSSNRASSSDTAYMALAVVLPQVGEEIEAPTDDAAEKLTESVSNEGEALKEKAKEAERAEQEAQKAKERGFLADCGNNPDACMYERAYSLASLSGGSNPCYKSVDAWSFTVALKRARAYYRARLRQEAPAYDSWEERARSALRANFYRYACAELDKAYVRETDDSFSAYFPKMPKNTSEMRGTSLYTECVYPVTSAGDGLMMHAWAGCPNASGYGYLGSLAQQESGGFETCPICEFTGASVGRVASATSAVPSGFEYHYNRVAQAAEEYEKARAEADALGGQVRKKAGNLLDECKKALESLKGKRIEINPPGEKGAIAFAVDTAEIPASSGFQTSFVQERGSLGTRAALSGAALLEEKSTGEASALTALLESVKSEIGSGFSLADLALELWSDLLGGYENGQQTLMKGLERSLDGVPILGSSSLGSWAAKKIANLFEAVGLEPAKTGSARPVLVNTSRVAEAGEDDFSARFVSVKAGAQDVFGSINEVQSWAQDALAHQALGGMLVGESIEIAVLEPLGSNGPSIPLRLPLPQGVRSVFDSVLGRIAQGIAGLQQETEGVRPWK